MSRLDDELKRVFGDPPTSPRAVVRVQVASGQGLAAGREEGDRFVDAGADLVVLDADLTGPAALAAVAVLLGLEPVAMVGTDVTDGWKELVVAVRSQIRAVRCHAGDPEQLVEALGDPAFGRVVGLLDRLAARRTPVLLGGGTSVAAAALVAGRLQPGAERWWLAGSTPVHPAGTTALVGAGLTPLLDLGLTDGSADVAVAVVRAGLELLGA
ncbi:MAG: Nicotinate-nucleotide--dimethylbenzimidazole phosphoribosyltransferase [Frankiales bacterium]|nr:Nicotinate-nucleotide--dimethylbenzimidazole phosphoribosyltransferase [Frankiales bacterium]